MASIAPYPFLQFFDSNGDPLSGGKVYFYEAGTTTPKDTFTDQTGDTANANPVILDAAGRAQIWMSGSYKVVVKDSSDVTIDTTDVLTVGSASGDSTTIEATAGTNISAGDLCYLASADGKMEKADADAEATAAGLLAIALDTILENADGTFLLLGTYTTTGLTAGAEYYVSTTLGGYTSTQPSGSGDIVRYIGTALSTTQLYFNPSPDYVELS